MSTTHPIYPEHDFDEEIEKSLRAANWMDNYFSNNPHITVMGVPSLKVDKLGIDRVFKIDDILYSVEYKADFRTKQTGNIFVEIVSTQETPGWMYTMCSQNLMYFTDDDNWQNNRIYITPVAEMKKNFTKWASYRKVPAYNKGYVSYGRIVPFREYQKACEKVIKGIPQNDKGFDLAPFAAHDHFITPSAVRSLFPMFDSVLKDAIGERGRIETPDRTGLASPEIGIHRIYWLNKFRATVNYAVSPVIDDKVFVPTRITKDSCQQTWKGWVNGCLAQQVMVYLPDLHKIFWFSLPVIKKQLKEWKKAYPLHEMEQNEVRYSGYCIPLDVFQQTVHKVLAV